jgi:hypothetical protein
MGCFAAAFLANGGLLRRTWGWVPLVLVVAAIVLWLPFVRSNDFYVAVAVNFLIALAFLQVFQVATLLYVSRRAGRVRRQVEAASAGRSTASKTSR